MTKKLILSLLLGSLVLHACTDTSGESRRVSELITASEQMLDDGNIDSAWASLGQALHDAVIQKSPEGEAQVWLAMSRHHNMVDRPDSAVACLQRGLEAWPSASDELRAQYYAELSATYNILGDMQSCVDWAMKALPLIRTYGSDEDYAIFCGNTGIAYRRLGNADSAAVLYHQGLEHAMQVDDYASQAYLANNLSVLYTEMGRYEEGITYADMAIQDAERSDDSVERLSAVANKGIALQMSGQNESAISQLTIAFAEAQATKSTALKLKTINYLLRALIEDGQWEQAAAYLQTGDSIAAQLPQGNTGAAGILESKMIVQTEQGQYDAALKTIADIEELMKLQQVIPPFRLLRYKSKSVAGLGNYREAYQLLSQSMLLSDSVHSRESADKLDRLTTNIRVMEKELQLSRLSQKQAQTQRTVILLVAILAVLLATLALLMLWLRQRRGQAEIRATRKYVEGIEQERTRFARELHDGACNELLAIGMRLRSAVGNASEADGTAPGTPTSAVLDQITTLRAQLRNLSHELMPPQFADGVRLNDSLAYYLSHLDKPVIHFRTEGSAWESIPPAIAYQFYRIAQEAIGNIIVHQPEAVAEVALTCGNDGSLSLRILSEGDVMTGDGHGIGLQSLRDRANSISATLTIEQTAERFLLSLVRH